MQLAAGDYQWCRCGESQRFPFCDARQGCTPTGFQVRPRRVPETLWLCGCGATRTAPFCDGSHNRLSASQRR